MSLTKWLNSNWFKADLVSDYGLMTSIKKRQSAEQCDFLGGNRCGAGALSKQDLLPCPSYIKNSKLQTQIPYLMGYCHPCSRRLEALFIAALLVTAQFIVAFLFTQDNYSIYRWKTLAFTTGRLRKCVLSVYTVRTRPRRGSFSLVAGKCLLIPALPPKIIA